MRECGYALKKLKERIDDDLGIQIWARQHWSFILQSPPYGLRGTAEIAKVDVYQDPVRRTGIATILRFNTDTYNIPIGDKCVEFANGSAGFLQQGSTTEYCPFSVAGARWSGFG